MADKILEGWVFSDDGLTPFEVFRDSHGETSVYEGDELRDDLESASEFADEYGRYYANITDFKVGNATDFPDFED